MDREDSGKVLQLRNVPACPERSGSFHGARRGDPFRLGGPRSSCKTHDIEKALEEGRESYLDLLARFVGSGEEKSTFGVRLPWKYCQSVLGLSRESVYDLACATLVERNAELPEAAVAAIIRTEGVTFPVGDHVAFMVELADGRFALWVKKANGQGDGRGSGA